tara:strand:+ start:289 stop:501 length:213 start_codon:yes stop_codon:yes gene_type:complete
MTKRRPCPHRAADTTKQEQTMTKRRWLKSVIAASQDTQVALPFQRSNRRRPDAFKAVETVTAPPRALAAS